MRNLVLVCGRHHTLVHREGFRLTLHDDRRLSVRTADGMPVLHHPPLPWRDRSELHLEAEVQRLSGTARRDLRHVVSVLVQQAA